MPMWLVYINIFQSNYPLGTERVEANIIGAALANFSEFYYVNMQAGYPVALPSQAKMNGIEVQRVFINENAENAENATNIKPGDEITVRLRVRSTYDRSLTEYSAASIVEVTATE